MLAMSGFGALIPTRGLRLLLTSMWLRFVYAWAQEALLRRSLALPVAMRLWAHLVSTPCCARVVLARAGITRFATSFSKLLFLSTRPLSSSRLG